MRSHYNSHKKEAIVEELETEEETPSARRHQPNIEVEGSQLNTYRLLFQEKEIINEI